MKVTVAEHAGYCFGVKRAIGIIEKAVAQSAGPVFTLGPIIHNPRVVAAQQKKGVCVVHGAAHDFPADATIILPSHGVTPAVRQKLERKGVNILDATCPRVLAVHEKIRAALRKGRRIFIAGDETHSEVTAFMGIGGDRISIIAKPRQIAQIDPDGSPSFLSAQTTFSAQLFREIEKELRNRIWDLDVFESLCGHTLKAQQSARRLAGRSDIMIIAGGKNSANTRRLREECRAAGARIRHVEKASALRKRDFSPGHSVGITAGASTPPDHIREIVDWLSARFEIELEKALK